MKNQMMNRSVVLGAVLVGLSSGVSAQAVDPAVMAIMESSFRTQGIADKSRIYPDEIQVLCSDKAVLNSPEGQKKGHCATNRSTCGD